MSKKIVAQNRTVLVGVDVHTSSHVVTTKVRQELTKPIRMSASKEAWRSFLKKYPGCELHVIYESGPNGFNLHDWMMELREEYEGGAIFVYIAPASLVPKAPGRKRMKTDKRDSVALIQAFEMKSFRPVVVPDKASREERELVRTRRQMMRLRTQLKNQVQGLMKFHGIEVHGCKVKWTLKWVEQLVANVKAADTTGSLFYAFSIKLKIYKEVTAAMARLDKRIERVCRKGRSAETAQKLAELPGIGRISAAIIATEVADFTAFDNSAAFASYVGVVPERAAAVTEHAVET